LYCQVNYQYLPYRLKDTLVWVKDGNDGKLRSNPGHHLRHAKEICLVCLKGNSPQGANFCTFLDVIRSKPRQNSRKPDEVYEIIEGLCPGGPYLELFGRRHNMRPGWVTVGNQIEEVEYLKGLDGNKQK
jgi:mRNA m6A methyltransferase catalytic subunit